MKGDPLFTKDYGMFFYKDINRPVDLEKSKAKRLYNSMKKYGFIKSYPITVKKKNGKHEIQDGQHRYAIAMKLNIPIYYVVIEQEISIPEINSTQDPWTTKTFIESWAKSGNSDYAEIIQFKDKHGLPITVCAALLAGTISYQNVALPIRDGKYKVKDRQHAELVGSVLNQIIPVYQRARTKNFIEAICAICRLKNIELKRLVENIRKHPHLLQPFGTRDTILTMLESVYNYGKRVLYPLAINAQNEMKKRNAIYKNNSEQ